VETTTEGGNGHGGGAGRFLAPLIAVGAISGIATGWLVGAPMARVAWIGEFFLGALKMVIVPLIMASMIAGIGALGDVRRLGRTGVWTVGYYVTTTAIAVSIGIALVLIVQPGAGIDVSSIEVPETVKGKHEFGITDFVLSLIWPNIVDAMTQMKLLPIIIFSLLFGGIATTMGSRGRVVLDFFSAVNEIMMQMVGVILWLAPIGIFALIAARLGEAGGAEGVKQTLKSLGAYTGTVLGGLAIHACIVLPLLLRGVGGRRVLRYARGLSEALISAFSTASSAATLPITIRDLKAKNGVREEAADFVPPLGATINMDGTALYEAVAAIYIAQAFGIELSATALFFVFVTATLASIGAAGIPEAGLVTMVIVLEAVNLPIEGIGLILAVDWLLDRFRTTVNVWGDAVGAAVVERRALGDPGTAGVA